VAIGVKRLRDQGVKTVGIDVMTHEHGAAEGATLALYSFDSFKSPSSRKPEVKFQKLSHLPSASDSSGTNALTWETGLVYGEAQNFARTLAETPANLMTPTIFAETVKEKIADLEGVEVIVRDKAWAEKMGMNAFLSVAKGSDEPCQFMEIWYRGGVRDGRPLALVGKGVTFDSGGISLKPSSKMADMKADMAGGAVVAATIYGIAKLRLPINVVCAIPLCENMPSGKANKPGDVVKGMNGKTIEIDNTDAEGRLILADALYYVSSTYKPHTLVDLATLTGAIVIALGEPYSAVFTNSDTLWNELSAAGNIANDPFWRMPFHSDYRKPVTKSTVADLINNAGRSAGACTAAAFLKEFVNGLYVEGSENADEEDTENKDNGSGEIIRYAHIDIAATMESSEDTGYLVKGMSGRPTRSIIEFARSLGES
ncbi:7778_t:CDS:2, partial [Paraglomus occultum]